MFKTLLSAVVISGMLIVHAQTKQKAATSKAGTQTKSKTAAASTKKPAAKPAATANKIKFTIKGKLEGYSNHLMILNLFHYDKLNLIDSSKTNENGEFVFNSSAKENSIVYLQYNANIAVPLIVENGSVITVNIAPQTGLNYELSGVKAEKSVSLHNFIKVFSKYSNELGALNQMMSTETDPTRSYQIQMNYAMKEQEYGKYLDTMIRLKSPLESYFVLFNFKEEQKSAEIKQIMKRMEPKEIGSTYYKELKALYDKNKTIEIGEMAPDIELPQPDGTKLKLSSLKGKVVLIDFWASWCGPCRAEFPNVKRVYEKYKSKGFEIYGVSLDKERSAWVNSISSLGLSWKHVSDLQYWNCAPAKVYKVSGIPFTVLIDKEGRIIAMNLRGEQLEEKLKELFP